MTLLDLSLGRRDLQQRDGRGRAQGIVARVGGGIDGGPWEESEK